MVISYKKGQDEIVGFVLIVVIVAVLMLIFLFIMLKNPSVDYRESKEITQFLESSMEYTSNCAINYVPDYSKIGELIRECNSNRICLSGESACDVLNDTIKEMIELSWKIGEDRPIKGFIFNSSYYVNSSLKDESKEILVIKQGNCSGSYAGGEDLTPDYPGNILTRLLICY